MHTCAPGVQEAVYHGEESERQPESATPTAWRSRSGLLSADAERRWNQRFTAGCERSGLELPLKTTEGSGLQRRLRPLFREGGVCTLHPSFSLSSGRLRRVGPRPGRRPRCCLQLELRN